MIAQVLLALKEIHLKNFTCWNLSPETIFLDGEGHIILNKKNVEIYKYFYFVNKRKCRNCGSPACYFTWRSTTYKYR